DAQNGRASVLQHLQPHLAAATLAPRRADPRLVGRGPALTRTRNPAPRPGQCPGPRWAGVRTEIRTAAGERELASGRER
ncbi:hypothetical protein, partial [Gordonia alkanivorans]|uniref:hypothetical protein n=1 Tax=Gordonia alkanivorans TaxID=84096 RepID=UPI0024B790A4